MFNSDDMQMYQQWIESCNQRDLQAFVPFYVERSYHWLYRSPKFNLVCMHKLDVFFVKS